MREGNVAQLLDWNDARDGLANNWKQFSKPGVENQRLLVQNQILIEREAARTLYRYRCVNTEDAVRDLVDAGSRLGVCDRHWLLLRRMRRAFFAKLTLGRYPVLQRARDLRRSPTELLHGALGSQLRRTPGDERNRQRADRMVVLQDRRGVVHH